MKNALTLLATFSLSVFVAQNIGVNQSVPTNSLHVSPVNTGDHPIRIDGLQSYTIGDTSLLILDQASGVVKYISTTDFVNIINSGGSLGTDNQNIDSITLAGTNLTIYIENGTSAMVDLTSLQDADGDPTNEIELPATAVTNQVLTWNGTAWVAQNAGAGADNWGVQTVVTGAGLSGSGTSGSPLVNTFTEVDGVIGNEYNTNFQVNGTNLEITDGGGTLTVPINTLGTDNQTLSLSGNTLTISGGNNVTLTDNVNDADFVIGNEYNTGAALSGTTLSITDGGGSQTVNLSSLVDHDWYEVGGTSAPNSINDNIYTQGNVAIGIVNPSQKLHVYGGNIFAQNSNTFQSVLLRQDGGVELYRNPLGSTPYNSGYIDFKDNSTDDSDYRIWYNNTIGTDGALQFSGSTTGIPSTAAHLVIRNQDGNVGVGTVSPTEKLHINGNVKIGLAKEVPTQPSGSGKTLIFSGAPDVSGSFNNENSDYISLFRYNIAHDVSELRLNVGDNNTAGNFDSFLIGCNPSNVWTERFRFSSNGVASKPGGGTWATISDRRTKKEINNFTDGLNILKEINPVTFQYNGQYNTSDDGNKYVGIIAQDVKKVAPYMIGSYQASKEVDGTVKEEILNYDGGTYMLYVLVNSVKEQQKQIEELIKSNEILENEILLLKKK